MLVRNLNTKYVRVVRVESLSTIYSMLDTRHCLDCDARPLKCVFYSNPTWDQRDLSLLNHHWVIGSAHKISHKNSQMFLPVKIVCNKESKNYFLLGIVNDIPTESLTL